MTSPLTTATILFVGPASGAARRAGTGARGCDHAGMLIAVVDSTAAVIIIRGSLAIVVIGACPGIRLARETAVQSAWKPNWPTVLNVTWNRMMLAPVSPFNEV